MTLQEYYKEIKELLESSPNLKNAIIIYASDDEGNGFQRSENGLTPCCVEDTEQYHLDGVDFEMEDDEEPNAICIN